MRRGWPAALPVVVLLAGCGTGGRSDTPAAPAPSAVTGTAATSPATTPATTPAPAGSATPGASPTPARPALGTVPPGWLGTRVLPHPPGGFGRIEPTPPALRDRRFTLPDRLPQLPGTGFASRVEPAPAAVLARSTWQPGCPVAAADLAWVRLAFHGFDGRRHTGELLVHRRVAGPLVQVFHRLYDARYPIEEMRITRRDEQTAPPTGDGNDTGAFNCRPVVGQRVYSQHAYGLAVDVNPFQNPYLKGDLVLPELASAYRDRGRVRPGMILPGDAVVRAFTAIGWTWGGSWHSLKDLQHFSATGG